MDKLEPLQLRRTSAEQRPACHQALVLPFLDEDGEARMENRAAELERMMMELQDKAAVAEREAYNKAYQMGEKAGLELGKRRAENILAELQQLLDMFHGHVKEVYQQLDQQVIALANMVSKKLMGSSIRDEGMMEALIRRAIEASEFDLAESRLVLHPEDIERIRLMLQEEEIPLICATDSAIQPGTARLHSHDGMVLIDVSRAIDQCFDFIRTKVAEEWEEEAR